MVTQNISNSQGLPLGRIDTDSNGVSMAYGWTGMYLGQHDPKQNTTLNSTNSSIVSQGNVLAMLIIMDAMRNGRQ